LKIITRYILKEHVGPMTFAFVALTSLMLLNFISRQFGALVGKGLPWGVIGEFFLLSIPFTVALTIPMSVLVAVLYVFSRLAAENEVTAFKASGVSPWALVAPSVGLGVLMSLGLLAFNDQILPRANHRLKTLQQDISETKPTLLLKEQVINTVAEGRLYLKAGKINGGHLREVVIYDLSNPQRRRTIYADSGRISLATNHVDLDMELYHGQMQEVSTDKPEQLDRMFYASDRIRVKNVGKEFSQSKADPTSKGDREMGICEMQRRLWAAEQGYRAAVTEYDEATDPKKRSKADTPTMTAPPFKTIPEPKGLGWAYCTLFRALGVKEVQAAEVPQDTVKKVQDTAKKPVDTTQHPPVVAPLVLPGAPVVTLGGGSTTNVPPGAQPPATADAAEQARIAAEAAASLMRAKAAANVPPDPMAGLNSRGIEARMRLDIAEKTRNRFDIEIQKKFSLAAACLIFCILAPPIALRFPRGGVGLVIGVSLAVFALYYVGLIGGESAANHGYVPPFWAMWGTNVIMTVVGFVMMFRIRNDAGSGRAGGFREWLDTRRMLREEKRTRRGAR
jgi:lipopolysaccharide export system permease protein